MKCLLECLYIDTGSVNAVPYYYYYYYYRDSYYEIRALCINELGVWMNGYRLIVQCNVCLVIY